MANKPEHPINVCIFCPDAYPMYVPTDHSVAGGAEFRSAMFARHLAQHENMDVHAYVHYFKGFTSQTVDGVKLVSFASVGGWLKYNLMRTLAEVKKKPQFPWVKLTGLHWTEMWRLPLGFLTHLWMTYRQPRRNAAFQHTYDAVPANVFCCFGMLNTTADAVYTCQKTGRKSILMVASDDDLSLRFVSSSDAHAELNESPRACRQIMDQVSAVVVQTEYQKQLLKQRFGRDGIVICNPIDLDTFAQHPLPELPSQYVLWVGRSDTTNKRPHLCLEIAEQLPEVSFVMVMSNTQGHVHEQILAQRPANVTIMDHVPTSEFERLYLNASCFLNTSSYEGFPNTFLLAGKYSVPVVSLKVDPDSILSRCVGGLVAGDDMTRLVQMVETCWNDQPTRNQFGNNLCEYVQSHHNAKVTTQQLADLITKLMNDNSSVTPDQHASELSN